MGVVPDDGSEEERPSRLDRLAREAIAGHPRGAVRRIVLWVVAFAALVVTILVVPVMSFPAGISFTVAFMALALLALTDGLL